MSTLATGRLRRRLGERFVRWATRREKIAQGSLTLTQRRIFILPTRFGVFFSILLFIMLLGSINYGNSLGFMLTFLLAGLGANGLWQTHRNLLQLTVHPVGAEPVFAGHDARFRFRIENTSRRPRYAVALQWREHPISLIDVEAWSATVAELQVAAPRRGLLVPGRFRVFTRYPLNLFQAWSWVTFDVSTLVYPKPLAVTRDMPSADGGTGERGASAEGKEDYAGLRAYHQGDSPRHIAWKAAARAEVLYTKLFEGETHQEIWLDWEALQGMEPELRLSVLCRWVLDAEAAGLRYGLSLPGAVVPVATGETQRRRCLKALALHGRAKDTDA